MEKKKYIAVIMEIEYFQCEDIITASTDPGKDDPYNDGWEG